MTHRHPPSLETPDAELLCALYAGHLEALGQLYDRYSSLVYSLALRILAEPTDAEDLTQEIFLILWRKPTYDPRRGSLSSFLATLTRSRAIDRLRSRTSKQKFLTRWQRTMSADVTPSSPFDRASLQERRDRVRQALAQLPPQQRQVLELSYYEGCSQSQIAKRLNTPLGTVKTWARKGLLQLRENLKHFLGEYE
ncbi:sigma-70 family RNA polymerase sigma factor [Lusitaniella coriacea LEGE 07157]|uniref:Sigma-70 family RNA polymerase sigma factor n=1 Tax=Lusitaniella coriacea LEGE 07157 TaxID=945747 RepID=A0A8J7IS76_9CYAN|nr:sigma-70 family RNA polymerase sigma factor [Lusitaniella coriacea]MBE9115967.1 sigma-70 family RNA polymerase sigma factor [Lusitaniella coriacea LEGE 07157]